jgi:hypothetical protein
MRQVSAEIVRWQTRLADTFRGPNGLIGERLCLLQEAERAAEREGLTNYGGYSIAADAFFDFAIQSLGFLAKPMGVYHIIRTPLLVATVSRLRSSYVLFWKGYWFDGASLLRGIFENVVHLCAAAQGWFDISSRFDVEGIDLSQDFLAIAKERHKLRIAREANVTSRIYGKKSGLTEDDQREIAELVKMMHSHVHETEMHLIHLATEVKRSRTPASVFPAWDNHQASHYGHISLFLAWSVARLLAYAVPQQQRSEEWITRRDVLDEAFRLYFADWDKPLSGTLVRFLDAKFVFTGEWIAPPPGVA